MELKEILSIGKEIASTTLSNKLMDTVTTGLERTNKTNAIRENITLAKELGIPYNPTAEQKKKIHDKITSQYEDL